MSSRLFSSISAMIRSGSRERIAARSTSCPPPIFGRVAISFLGYLQNLVTAIIFSVAPRAKRVSVRLGTRGMILCGGLSIRISLPFISRKTPPPISLFCGTDITEVTIKSAPARISPVPVMIFILILQRLCYYQIPLHRRANRDRRVVAELVSAQAKTRFVYPLGATRDWFALDQG